MRIRTRTGMRMINKLSHLYNQDEDEDEDDEG